MKIKLVFADWQERGGRSVYHTAVGVNLTVGQFHSGTTFSGSIRLSAEDEEELADAMRKGYQPVFCLLPADRAARKA